MSPYVYCNNNPSLFNDPFGLITTMPKEDPRAGFEGHGAKNLGNVTVVGHRQNNSGPVTFQILMAINPNGNRINTAAIVKPLNDHLRDFHIDTKLGLAHFLAQISHETGGFNHFNENWHYRSAGILATWPRHFNQSNVGQYVNSPTVFDRAYASRMGNGSEASRDGSRYSGRGLIQLTGRDSYTRFNQWYQSFYGDNFVNFVSDPDLISTNMKFAAISALWEFSIDKRLNRAANNDDLDYITRRINGGLIGIEDRRRRLQRAKEALGIMK